MSTMELLLVVCATCSSRAFSHLVEDDPVGVDLSVALWVQHHRLVGPEVCHSDLCILGAAVDTVDHLVVVKVSKTSIAMWATCSV